MLRFLRNLGVIKVYPIFYQGHAVSTNDLYTQGHWSKRSKAKNQFSRIFQVLLLKARLPWMNTYALVMFYNSRHDPDNASTLIKVFLDTLKQRRLRGKVITKGYVYDDSKKYCKGVMIIPDESLGNNTFEFTIVCF